MNTVRQRAYVGFMLATLAFAVAFTMMALAARPEPYVLGDIEVAAQPVLGQVSSPDCLPTATTSCEDAPGQPEPFDFGATAGQFERANQAIEVEATTTTTNDTTLDPAPSTAPAAPEASTTTTAPKNSTTTAQAVDNIGDRSNDNTSNDNTSNDNTSNDNDNDKPKDNTSKNEDNKKNDGPKNKNEDKNKGNDGSKKRADRKKGSSGDGTDDHELSDFEQAVIDLTNKRRRSAGCDPLKPHRALNQAARAHSMDMAKNKFFEHRGSDDSSPGTRSIDRGFPNRFIAENIAWGYRSPEAVVKAWMDSKDHRANITHCGFTHIGVGVHKRYWTQSFGIIS